MKPFKRYRGIYSKFKDEVKTDYPRWLVAFRIRKGRRYVTVTLDSVNARRRKEACRLIEKYFGKAYCAGISTEKGIITWRLNPELDKLPKHVRVWDGKMDV